MKQVSPADGLAAKIYGRGKPDPDRCYRKSLFAAEVPCEDGVIFFHTLAGSMFLLNEVDAEQLSEALLRELPLRELEQTVSAECFRTVTELIRERYLVPDDTDEIKHASEVRSMMELMMLQKEKKVKNAFTILTTTDCNARCFYCYEMGRSRITMSEKTAADVALYIINACGGEKVSLNWFGGEPLKNKPAIDIITGKLRERNIEFSSSVTTNGYYLDRETVRKCKDAWNVKRIQITLDGTEKTYNRIKAYREADPNPYETVLGNMEEALKAGLGIGIRLNMDAKNAGDLNDLVDELARRFSGFENVKIYAALLREFAGSIHEFSGEDKAAEQCLLLQRKIEENGLGSAARLKPQIRLNRCMADSDSAEVILPDGRIGKCEHISESDFIGTIYDPARDSALIRAWKERREPYPECRTCPLFPRCIILKKCAWTEDKCRHSKRILRLTRLKKEILQAYTEKRADAE